MVQVIGKTTNGEDVVRVNCKDSHLVAFVGEKEVDLITTAYSDNTKAETQITMDRKTWDSFAGKSLQMARKSEIPIV